MSVSSAIYGCAGPELSADEKTFFRETSPWGFILFARNIVSPDQVLHLTASLREAAGRDAPILIDQEGGRVQRLRPPHWRSWPAGRRYGELYARDAEKALHAVRLGARLMAAELRSAGITVDCLPVLDVPVPGAHDVIGDRAYALEPKPVAALGLAAAEGLIAGACCPSSSTFQGMGVQERTATKNCPS